MASQKFPILWQAIISPWDQNRVDTGSSDRDQIQIRGFRLNLIRSELNRLIMFSSLSSSCFRTRCRTRENHGRLLSISRLRLRGHVTTVSAGSHGPWRIWSFILSCTKQTGPGGHSHRTSADCYFGVTSHSMTFTNHLWLLRKSKEPLCDGVGRSCSDLKCLNNKYLWMENGEWASGRCNTYFNVSCCFSCLCIVQCHGYWSVWSTERD